MSAATDAGSHHRSDDSTFCSRQIKANSHPNRCVQAHEYATVVVDQIVAVVLQPRRRIALGRIGIIWIPSRNSVLPMHRLVGWVLPLQFDQVLGQQFGSPAPLPLPRGTRLFFEAFASTKMPSTNSACPASIPLPLSGATPRQRRSHSHNIPTASLGFIEALVRDLEQLFGC
jgi:hypothetical protein